MAIRVNRPRRRRHHSRHPAPAEQLRPQGGRRPDRQAGGGRQHRCRAGGGGTRRRLQPAPHRTLPGGGGRQRRAARRGAEQGRPSKRTWRPAWPRVRAAAPDVPVHATCCKSGLGLDDLHTYLAPGRTVALLGSSGVGKSTIINPPARRAAAEDAGGPRRRQPGPAHDHPPGAHRGAGRRHHHRYAGHARAASSGTTNRALEDAFAEIDALRRRLPVPGLPPPAGAGVRGPRRGRRRPSARHPPDALPAPGRRTGAPGSAAATNSRVSKRRNAPGSRTARCARCTPHPERTPSCLHAASGARRSSPPCSRSPRPASALAQEEGARHHPRRAPDRRHGRHPVERAPLRDRLDDHARGRSARSGGTTTCPS